MNIKNNMNITNIMNIMKNVNIVSIRNITYNMKNIKIMSIIVFLAGGVKQLFKTTEILKIVTVKPDFFF